MPFVQRVVTPKYISRSSRLQSNSVEHNNSTGYSTSCIQPLPVKDNELEAVTNITLSNALRQLASLLIVSKEIFDDLNKELQLVSDRSQRIKNKITAIQTTVDKFDPKLVPVPESDLESFVQIKTHFKSNYEIETKLFTAETRSETIQKMYDAAAKTPVPAIVEMDKIMGVRGRRSSDAFICTPVLGQTRRKIKKNLDIEIETRMPEAVNDLRKWTSNEAIGDITVAPDCVARVNVDTTITNSTFNTTSVSTSSPESASEDCTDDIIVIRRNVNNNDSGNDMPLDHRLPSPEEQCQILALKYPAQVVSVNVTGRYFDRMSAARKSLLHVQMGLSEVEVGSGEDTVQRRSRSRKPRGKRRNTIAGTDQKEIEGVVSNKIESEAENDAAAATNINLDKITIVPRSKSSDILKNDGPSDLLAPKRSSSHFNSLKQWGKNRLRMINNRNSQDADANNRKDKVPDIDDFNVLETIVRNNGTNNNINNNNKKDRKLSHERKPSYSSSEKSLVINGNALMASVINQPVATINPVKMRESSSIRRQRRSLGLATKDEPHSSSGNWSASSESGRTSIGSEITNTTVHPKSSASSTSLNHNVHQPSSGPPSSIISRRRFLNTSASSSITSEGTATPDFQMCDFHDEGETSSVYSCDTEGYYTSFHVDSGLKTLKEEESTTPIAMSSTTSFESSGNQTVISPENEYEMFGRGSTSTTTSSAGTVCTAVLSHEKEKYSIGPCVPERKSSLTKLNRSSSSASSGTLERCYSSSTVGSTLERSGTIKKNGVLLQKEVAALVHQHKEETILSRTESPDSGHNTSSSPIETNSNSSPTQGVRTYSEFEYSESSDLECVDRIERIRVKTTINTSRIPSMCVITPTPSDDESVKQKENCNEITIKIKDNDLKLNKETGYATVLPSASASTSSSVPELKKDFQQFKKAKLLPLNTVFGKLKGVLHPLKKSPNKENVPENVYDTAGEYVTIKDANKTQSNGLYYSNDIVKRNLATVLSGNLNEETEYVSLNELPCNMKSESNLLAIYDDDNNKKIDKNIVVASESNIYVDVEGNEYGNGQEKEEGMRMKGARVTLDAHGKIIYSSDSLKRRKGAHTTFSPGPCVKEENDPCTIINVVCESNSTVPPVTKNTLVTSVSSPLLSGGVSNRKIGTIRPITVTQNNTNSSTNNNNNNNNNLVDQNNSNSSQPKNIRMQQSPMVGNNINTPYKGAYVNIQDAAPLRNGPPVYTPPGVYSDEDYQPNYRDMAYSGPQNYGNNFPYVTQTMPPHIVTSPHQQNGQNNQELPLQRNNNIYWTLQLRNRHTSNAYNYNSGARDDLNVDQQYHSPDENDAELYSTPNKNYHAQYDYNPTGNSPNYEDDQCDSMVSPINPRNTGGFSTSTPQNNADASANKSPTKISIADELRSRLRLEDSGIRSHGNSPINSGRSTPKGILEPQARTRHSWSNNNAEIPQTCSDRLGTPKTSLMDFKKLLLNKGSLPRPGKISAVEQLKMSKTHIQKSPTPQSSGNKLNTSMNILDLSGSPKTFATRRMIRQGQFGTNLSNSPSKTMVNPTKHTGKHGWRFQNMRTDVISTAIPEANSEEDNSSPNASNERTKSQQKLEDEIAGNLPEVTEKEEKPLNTIFEEKPLNIKDNIFMKEDENNFTTTEIQQQKKSTLYTRAQLQQQRAQFLLGSPTANVSTNNNKTAQFKNGHYAGIVTTIPTTETTTSSLSEKPATVSNNITNNRQISTTITIVTTSLTPVTSSLTTSNNIGGNSAPTPSLETSL